jgi:hypothetical protein
MWALYVIVMMANLELYQTLFGIPDPRWSCSTVKFRVSVALELFLQSWSSPKHALHWPRKLRERENNYRPVTSESRHAQAFIFAYLHKRPNFSSKTEIILPIFLEISTQHPKESLCFCCESGCHHAPII